MKHWVYKELTHFFYSKIINKKKSCTWTIISIYYNNLQKNVQKTHLYGKKIGHKDM
jgi:hypothetical protein